MRISSPAGMVIFSGIQPTGRKHLGNYIGAIRQYVEGQDRADPSIYCIVDMHAITVEYSRPCCASGSTTPTAVLVAAGLDPEHCILFRQGDVHGTPSCAAAAHGRDRHRQAGWRVPQFRDESVAQRQLVSVGLLLYPVLQAADVLAYRAHEVPVGEDQREHLELMRDIARRFAGQRGDPSSKPVFLSGSGGLLSTTDDYFRFAQMVLNGGEANGKRFLKASTVELMRTNVLADGVAVDTYGPSQPGIGFGLDFAIVMDPAAANTPEGRSSFYWGGAFGTWFWIDPTNDVVVVGMMQNVNGSSPTGGSPQVRPLSRQLVYQALVDPKK